MGNYRNLIPVLAALLLTSGAAAAQDARQLRVWDRNSDGVITRTEWRGTIQEFRQLDLNRDGVLSGNELRYVNNSDQFDDESFFALDRNGNGRITRGEWDRDIATFELVDRNNDNQITRSEFLNANVRNRSDLGRDFDELDYNGNGRIEIAEWNGTRAAFNRLDVNRDGVLSSWEMSNSNNDAVRSGGSDFDLLDYDNNGVISRNEWRGNQGAFGRYDRNRDGVVTLREYNAGPTATAVVEDTVVIDPRQAWTDTNLYVNAGDVITVRAEGVIQMVTGGDDRATPAGSITGRTASGSPRPDQKAGILLGRIGNSPVMVVGAGGTMTAQNSGRIQFGVNDDHFADNSGQYRVSVRINPR
jgi:Ca2+-binding EF-hand superfamily protein